MLTPQLEQQLRDEFARVGGRIQAPDDLTERLLGHGYRPRGPRRRLLALSGAGALLLVIALVVVLVGAGTESHATSRGQRRRGISPSGWSMTR